MKFEENTERMIGCVYRVYNKMGFGFLESVYEKCMLIELAKSGLEAKTQQPIKVHDDGEIVGEFVADLLVKNQIIVELKSVRTIVQAHEIQLLNDRVATHTEVGLILNFAERKVEVKRKREGVRFKFGVFSSV